MNRKTTYWHLGAASLATCFVTGCADLPRDQKGWTSQIQQERKLVVGTARAADELSKVAAREKRLVQKIAARLGARVVWQSGNSHHLLQELEEAKLPLVAATVSSDSPFAEKIGLSRPYWKKGPNHKDYCLAVAPGENRLLLIIDQIIAQEEKSQSS